MSDDLAAVSVLAVDGVALVAVCGEIDLSNADDVRLAITGARRDIPLVVDLTEVRHIDSIGVAMLAGLGPGVHLVAPGAGVAGRLLTMVGLGMPTHESRGPAVHAARGREGAD